MAAEFLGGLGNFATSFMKGYDQAEDREALLKERQFQEGQRQRKLDEQRRADELRNADAGVKTTEEIQEPGTNTIDGKPAITRDDEGNLMPGAVETPTKTVTRQRSWDAIYRDYAANRQKLGDTAGALEFNDKANKVAAQRAANAFLQVQVDAASKTPMQLAQEIGKIFDSDPMNGGTKSIEELPDGGVRMTLFNKDTGQTSTREFKGPKAREDLLAAFTPYFRPESYAKLLDKQSEISAEIAKDPYKSVPGGYVDKRTGKFTPSSNGIPILDSEGNVIGYQGVKAVGGTGTGSGSGSKKGPKSPADEAGEILKDAMGGKGDGSPEGAARYTRAHSYLDGIYTSNPNIPARTAAAIAADASADPTKITLQLDNKTGQISKVYKNPDFEGGRQFNLGPNSGTVAEMEKSVGKSGMQQAVGGMIADLASNVAPEQQEAFRTQLIQAANDPKVRSQVLAAAKDNGQDVQAVSRQLDLIKAYGTPAQNPNRTNKPDVGGIKMPATDPNSPAGRAQARQAKLREEAQAAEAQRLENQKKLSAQFRADAKTMSGIELERKYDRQRGDLPREDQIELRRLAAQAYRSGQ